MAVFAATVCTATNHFDPNDHRAKTRLSLQIQYLFRYGGEGCDYFGRTLLWDCLWIGCQVQVATIHHTFVRRKPLKRPFSVIANGGENLCTPKYEPLASLWPD
jgi:hypothetical protein